MTITPLAITNPGAETGDTTGWTQSAGSGFVSRATSYAGGYGPYAGTRMFAMGAGDSAAFYQQFDISAIAAAIDANTASVNLQAWHRTISDSVVWQDDAALRIQFYDVAMVLISTLINPYTSPTVWTHDQILANIPVNTRYIRVGAICQGSDSGSTQDVFWDDFTLEISDDRFADYPGVFDPHVSQFGSYALGSMDAAEDDAPVRASTAAMYAMASAPAEEAIANQTFMVAMGQAETIDPLDYPDPETMPEPYHDVSSFQLGAYALVRGRPDSRRVRAWTFTQDDHDFYVLHLGADKSAIFDLLTEQWATWKSNGKAIWRASIGLAWEADNIGGDVTAGLLWNIDPTVRDDDGVSGLAEDRLPIVSIIRGLFPVRLRHALGCFRATVTASQGAPVAAGVGIQLRTSDDFSLQEWTDHGLLVMDDPAVRYDISWMSLGQMTQPGRFFEIIDTGYAARIDALDIDLGDETEGSTSG